jgi:hypothetical protein
MTLVCGIEKMYIRIAVSPGYRTYQRFMWREMRPEANPDINEFISVVFGVNWYPFQAQSVANTQAEKENRRLSFGIRNGNYVYERQHGFCI